MGNTAVHMQQSIDLNSLLVFVRVIELRSFTEAATALNMQKSTVSRIISGLESALNRQLIYRTTRRIEPTPQGRDLFARCNGSLSALLLNLKESRDNTEPMQGKIRIAAVQDIGIALLGPILTEFAELHPKLEMELLFEDKVVDLVANTVDISVRAGRIVQQSYRGRKIGTIKFILVASPKYLEKVRHEVTEDNIKEVDFIAYQPMLAKGHLLLEKGTRRVKFSPCLRFQSSSTLALYQLACAGAGVSFLPDFLCEEALKSNALVPILKGWSSPPIPLSVVTPAKKDASSTVAVFSSFLSKKLKARIG